MRFNKEGNLLAVSTVDNGIKILATASGLRSLRTVEDPPFEALKTPIEAAAIKVTFYDLYYINQWNFVLMAYF